MLTVTNSEVWKLVTCVGEEEIYNACEEVEEEEQGTCTWGASTRKQAKDYDNITHMLYMIGENRGLVTDEPVEFEK